MDWIIALAILLLAGLVGHVAVIARSDGSARRKGVAGSFFTGLAEAIDPNAAMIALENEKRANMEGEEDNGDDKDPIAPPLTPAGKGFLIPFVQNLRP